MEFLTLFRTVANEVVERYERRELWKFNPRVLANIVDAFALAGMNDSMNKEYLHPGLLSVISDEVDQNLDVFTPKELSLIARSFAKAGLLDPTIFSITPQSIFNMASAIAIAENPSFVTVVKDVRSEVYEDSPGAKGKDGEVSIVKQLCIQY
jgi:hypothetical protein